MIKIFLFSLLFIISVNSTCVAINGVVESPEECDPAILSIPCSSDCLLTCGNGVTDLSAGEDCDNSDISVNDTCSDTCKYCGNGAPDMG